MEKQLRVWWIPQVPMKPFYAEVKTLEEAHLLLETLAMYDAFQFDNNIKPDYSNVGGLQYWEESEKDWWDWNDEETGDDFDEYRKEKFDKIVFPKK